MNRLRFSTVLLTLLATLIVANVRAQQPGRLAEAGSEVALHAFRVPAPVLGAVRDQLQQKYAQRADVRIAADERTSQIIVSAPADVRREIEATITRLAVAERLPSVNENAPSGRPALPTAIGTDGSADVSVRVPFTNSNRDKVREAVAAFLLAREQSRSRDDGPAEPPRNAHLIAKLFQQPGAEETATAGDGPNNAAEAEADAPANNEEAAAAGGAMNGPVRIEFLEGLDVLVVRGHKDDVARVLRVIDDIERLSAETVPAIEVYRLQHANNEAVAELVEQLYGQVLAPRHGSITITPLGKPNALLLVGRAEAVKGAIDLIKAVDEPVDPSTQFRVYQLAHLAALDAAQAIEDFYEERIALGAKVRVIPEYRSNAVIVQASPRDLDEVAALLAEIDVSASAASNEVRVFHLKNTLAEDLAPVLQEAITGSRSGQQGGNQVPGGGQTTGSQQNRNSGARSSMLTLATLDSQGRKILKSGILADVRVTGDARANALLVTGPAESMDLIAELIAQLDQLPTAEAQIKVFTIINGDAVGLADMLNELFGQSQQADQPATQTGAGQGESSLVPLRFSVDERTNSIIASGSSGDLTVVEAILLRLDEEDINQRESTVYRLRYAPALDVANAINEFLRSERQVQDIAPESVSPFEQIEREVVVVPEPVSNALIVSATPEFFEEIKRIVEDLDRRPPMVLIQVLIAEVALNDEYEFGTELGIQDSLLFDRSVFDAATGTQIPGFNFNNQDLGNASRADSRDTRESLAGQALSNFAVMRTNADLGYGGLILSAGSDSLSILLRALQDDRRLDILSRPQVMTMDNQPAFVQVGQRVPRITSSQLTQNGTINNTVLENVGILLGVTPRISPDGLVVMEIDAEKSELGPIEDGIPISINSNGDVIRSPVINITTAQTTVSSRSGQTVVLGGLITKNKQTVTRSVPYLSNIPVLGHLMRYENIMHRRTELLIIMTPHVVDSEEDAEWLKQMETARMSWCLGDVVDIHGDIGATPYHGGAESVPTIYPDMQPNHPEAIPAPAEGAAPTDATSHAPASARMPSIVVAQQEIDAGMGTDVGPNAAQPLVRFSEPARTDSHPRTESERR
ncbi:MAG: hypothetical protein KDA42_10565 [Planctomycetales bacterium]|nr:hypothetical protein [Planctomycetales bacterium]